MNGALRLVGVLLASALASAPFPLSEARAQDGLEHWSKLYEIFSHPRCANCHVEDGRPMWSGAHYGVTRKHPMLVRGEPGTVAYASRQCIGCHTARNSPVLHGPPGAEGWQIPPPAMTWFAKSSADLCSQIKDPQRTGGRDLAAIIEHVRKDELVHWGWKPGPGREPAPYSVDEAITFLEAWAKAGAPCPSP
jgi:mono/diheme cytochrome c family protein